MEDFDVGCSRCGNEDVAGDFLVFHGYATLEQTLCRACLDDLAHDGVSVLDLSTDEDEDEDE